MIYETVTNRIEVTIFCTVPWTWLCEGYSRNFPWAVGHQFIFMKQLTPMPPGRNSPKHATTPGLSFIKPCDTLFHQSPQPITPASHPLPPAQGQSPYTPISGQKWVISMKAPTPGNSPDIGMHVSTIHRVNLFTNVTNIDSVSLIVNVP